MKGILFSFFISIALLFNNYTYLIPGGENIGIEIKPNGIVVIGGYDVVTSNYKYNPLKDSNIKKNDIIYQVNNKDINNVNEMLNVIKDNINDEYVNISLLRKNKKIETTLKFIKVSNANTIKTGLLVKERILGIGTVTFYDPESKIYGALGHKLIDSDFSNITDINSGTIYNSEVYGINKSSNGNVGQLLSNIIYDENVGTIFKNSDYGLFGYFDSCPDKNALQVASHDEIKLDSAYIYTTLDDNKVNKYEIEITSLAKQNTMATKGITFKIVDEKLLNLSGGIVQGMSGSPIIQDDKIVGAVTHVMVDNVKKGHGIYIDFMLQAALNG